MTKLESILGEGDSDLDEFRLGVGNLAFAGFSDQQIADFAIEEARAFRSDMNAELSKIGARPAFPENSDKGGAR